jgi:hypothetical protein
VVWVFFALGVVVVTAAGVAIGFVVARRVAGASERQSGGQDGAFMTPVGPPPDAERPAQDEVHDDGGARDG